MERRTAAAVAVLLAGAVGTVQGAEEDYRLYTPRPAETAQVPASPANGILVRTITIRRGDTLSALARKFFGRGSFYPEFLPFNEISNPDLIYAGEKLSVPLSKGAATAPAKKRVRKRAAAEKPEKTAPRKAERPAPAVDEPAAAPRGGKAGLTESDEYEGAARLYRQGEYERALTAFDAFLARHPDSIFAPDATLYRADCYLQLSGR